MVTQARNRGTSYKCLIPSLFVVIGTVMSRLLSLGAISLFSIPSPGYNLLSTSFLIEIAYNILITPIIFGVLNKIRLKFNPRGQYL